MENADVIEIPTQFMIEENFRKGHGVQCTAVDGSICLVVDETELWLDYESASNLIDSLSEVLLDAYVQIKNDMEELDGRE